MKGDPTYAVLCHCTDCQKATGSAFGANLFFKDAVRLVSGSAFSALLSGFQNVTIRDNQEQLRWFQDGDTPHQPRLLHVRIQDVHSPNHFTGERRAHYTRCIWSGG